jgi:light-regulated signal transduction histidine kinase (bacteriophytochrome)
MLERKYKGKLSSQADEYITNIVQGAKRMEMLLKDLLVYAKAINAPVENVSPVDINPVLSKALSNLCAAVNESKATIVYGELPAVKIHEVHLLQLFQNLIGNAIKYRSDEPPRVEISATREGRFWSICVKDNGIGVSPEYQEQIFRMFKRLHNADEYEGTGMGLAICQRIVERYGGRIWVESEKGKGSKFCFTAPAADSKMRAANA